MIFDNVAYVYLASSDSQKARAACEAFSAAGWIPSVICCPTSPGVQDQPHGRKQTSIRACSRLFDSIRYMRNLQCIPDPLQRNVFACSIEDGLIDGTDSDAGWMYDYANVCVHRCDTRVFCCTSSDPVRIPLYRGDMLYTDWLTCQYSPYARALLADGADLYLVYTKGNQRRSGVIAQSIYQLLRLQKYCNM